jgi:DNA-binding NarL/FixJ family response regulator
VTAPARSAEAPIRVALVSTYPTVRAGLRALLAAEPELVILSEASTLDDLLSESPEPLDVVVLDLDAPAGWQLGARLQELAADVGIVMLGPDGRGTNPAAAMGDRAWAYLLKEAGQLELTRAVAAVAAGLVVVQPPLLRRLTAPLASIALEEDTAAESLTTRENEVLQLVAQGLPNKTIAIRLGVSEHTVKFHVTSILGKLGASSRTEAVRLGARRGLIVL